MSMSVAEFRQMLSKKKPRIRNAQPVIDPDSGKRVDSKREMKMLTQQRARMKAGEIDVLAPQTVFRLEGCTYRADAVVGKVVMIDGKPHLPLEQVIDAKGFRTDIYKRSKRQMKERYSIDIQEV